MRLHCRYNNDSRLLLCVPHKREHVRPFYVIIGEQFPFERHTQRLLLYLQKKIIKGAFCLISKGLGRKQAKRRNEGTRSYDYDRKKRVKKGSFCSAITSAVNLFIKCVFVKACRQQSLPSSSYIGPFLFLCECESIVERRRRTHLRHLQPKQSPSLQIGTTTSTPPPRTLKTLQLSKSWPNAQRMNFELQKGLTSPALKFSCLVVFYSGQQGISWPWLSASLAALEDVLSICVMKVKTAIRVHLARSSSVIRRPLRRLSCI